MDKIWIIKGRSKYVKKFTVYKNESDLLKDIHSDFDLQILEYELKSSSEVSDYLLSKERDKQLRQVLGELSKEESAIQKFIKMYEELAPEGKEFEKRIFQAGSIKRIQSSKKIEILKRLKKFSNHKKQIVKIITDNKKYFLSEVSNNVDWYLTILSLHNFRSHVYDAPQKDTATEKIKQNFKLAKQLLIEKRKEN
jgi:hypothetical protein